MDRFGPTGKVSKKMVHLLRWSSFPGRTSWNFGRMDRAQNFRKFRSKTQWIGSVQTEKFGKNWSTFWGGPPFPVEPVWILVEWIAPKDTSVTDLQQDLISIRNRGFNNSLLINPGKTKLIVFRTKQTLSRLDDFKLSPLGKEVTPYVIFEFTWILSCPMTNIF